MHQDPLYETGGVLPVQVAGRIPGVTLAAAIQGRQGHSTISCMTLASDYALGYNDWLQTYTGKKFYPLTPRVEDVDVFDIAHALSLQCRYGGHVTRFYSVAEHCVILSHVVSPENALWALLHDATEAYLIDVPRPVKRLLTNYRDIESILMATIVEVYDIEPEMPEEVSIADTRILINERDLLMNPSGFQWKVDEQGLNPLDLPVPIQGWEPGVAETCYLDRLNELIN